MRAPDPRDEHRHGFYEVRVLLPPESVISKAGLDTISGIAYRYTPSKMFNMRVNVIHKVGFRRRAPSSSRPAQIPYMELSLAVYGQKYPPVLHENVHVLVVRDEAQGQAPPPAASRAPTEVKAAKNDHWFPFSLPTGFTWPASS